MATAFVQTAFFNQLKKYYTFYTGGFITFVIVLAILEQMGVTPKWIWATSSWPPPSPCMPASASCRRTADVSEYYVAGRTGSRTVQRHGDRRRLDVGRVVHRYGRHPVPVRLDGLAFVMGWTGGYVLVALFLAPYLRKFGQFTIPDFLGARYGGNCAHHRRDRRHHLFVHLRDRADLRRRHHHQPLHRPGVQASASSSVSPASWSARSWAACAR
jgi:cation/acetate symporter